jgi:hypothetical protein
MTTYQQIGIAAMLPGMQHMITLMQAELDSLRAQLGEIQEPAGAGRPAGSKAAPGRSGWPDDPEERSAEMKRRKAVAEAKKKRAKIGKSAKKRWETMSFKQRKERLAALAAGKIKAMKARKRQPSTPLVKLAEAS